MLKVSLKNPSKQLFQETFTSSVFLTISRAVLGANGVTGFFGVFWHFVKSSSYKNSEKQGIIWPIQ